MDSIRNVFSSLGTALAYPRVVLALWAVITGAAVLAVLPSFLATSDALAHHPGASGLLDQALDADLWRESPVVRISLLAGGVFMLLAGAFFSGGILARVGRPDVARFRFSSFLADCGRLFLRNLRVLIGAVLVCALLFWGVDVLMELIRGQALYGTDPGETVVPLYFFNIRWVHLLEWLAYLWGVLFLLVVFTSKVAMAHLAIHDRRSAFVGWSVATGRVLRHPIRALLCVTVLPAIWLVGNYGFGWLTARFLEAGDSLLIGGIIGQLSILFGIVVMVAFTVAARLFYGEVAVSRTQRIDDGRYDTDLSDGDALDDEPENFLDVGPTRPSSGADPKAVTA